MTEMDGNVAGWRFVAMAFTVFSLGIAIAQDDGCPVGVKNGGHENVEWSVAYGYHLTDELRDLPRVLLVGDSICKGYQEGVRKILDGKVNVSYWISSYCATSPSYLRLLEFYLDESTYDVIHINNGLHSLNASAVEHARGLRAAIELIRRKQPGARIIWASSTPLKDPVRTAKVRELNAEDSKAISQVGGIRRNDLFSLLDPEDREANWSDVFHHKPCLKEKEAAWVSSAILGALSEGSVTGGTREG